MPAGRPHEAVGNGSPRWMTAAPAQAGAQNPAYRPTHPLISSCGLLSGQLAGTFGSAPARGTSTIQTTAFTLVEHSDPAPAGFDQVVTFDTSPPSITINPAAIPAGAELSFGNFQVSQDSGRTMVGLIDTNSHTCASTATAPLTHGAGLVVGWAISPARAGSLPVRR
jgi:hypothetical protein